MAVIKFKKREEPVIEFGIRLPRIVYNLMSEIKNKKKAEEIVRETFNVNKNRLINIVEARDATDDVAMILAVYKNIMESEKDSGVLLLSPAFPSYDQYPNYEKRGEHFTKLVKG